jgi:preprotein translocase subunit SecA
MPKGTTVRLPDALKAEASTYADRLGVSLNALLAVALRDYLDHPARQGPGDTEPPDDLGDLPPLEAYPELAEDVPKVGRNEPCPCGSGKKYKVCHGR